MLKIFDIGIAMFIGSIISALKTYSKETSRFVDRRDSFSPSEEKRTEESTGKVVLVGTTLFKFFKASFKTLFLIENFINPPVRLY